MWRAYFAAFAPLPCTFPCGGLRDFAPATLKCNFAQKGRRRGKTRSPFAVYAGRRPELASQLGHPREKDSRGVLLDYHASERRGEKTPASPTPLHPWVSAVIVGYLPFPPKRCCCVLDSFLLSPTESL